jgi:hypothetical protein
VKALACAAMVGAALTAPGYAQTAGRAGSASAPAVQARQQVLAFEGVLENAVRQGTQMLEQRLREATDPNWVFVAGLTQARGFRLDDYGLLFDVEFPSMRRSMVWSLRALEQQAAAGKPRQVNEAFSSLQPRQIYQTEITNALVNAILDHSAAVAIGAEEWLTVAARESGFDRRFVTGDPADTAITVILRIKGRDLQALRERTLSRDEARKRVDVSSY